MRLPVDNLVTLKQHTVILSKRRRIPLLLKANCSLVGEFFKAQRLGLARIAPRRTGSFWNGMQCSDRISFLDSSFTLRMTIRLYRFGVRLHSRVTVWHNSQKRACAPQALFLTTLFFIPIIIRLKILCIGACVCHVYFFSTRLILPIIVITQFIPSSRIFKRNTR